MHGLPECPLGWARWGTSSYQPVGKEHGAASEDASKCKHPRIGRKRVQSTHQWTTHSALPPSAKVRVKHHTEESMWAKHRPPQTWMWRVATWQPAPAGAAAAGAAGARRAAAAAAGPQQFRCAHAGAAGAQPLPSRRLDPDGPFSCTAAPPPHPAIAHTSMAR